MSVVPRRNELTIVTGRNHKSMWFWYNLFLFGLILVGLVLSVAFGYYTVGEIITTCKSAAHDLYRLVEPFLLEYAVPFYHEYLEPNGSWQYGLRITGAVGSLVLLWGLRNYDPLAMR